MSKIVLKRFTIFIMAIMSLCCLYNFVVGNDISVFAQDTSNISITVNTTSVGEYVMGQVVGGGKYALGDTVVLEANPSAGCYFVNWQKRRMGETDFENIEGATNSVYEFVVSEDVEYRALFAFSEYNFRCDYLTYFQLTDLACENGVAPDSFVRATSLNIFDGGVFYYGDILTLDFEHKEGTYVQRLSNSQLSSNSGKTNVIINIDSLNKVTSIEADGRETSFASFDMTFDELIASGNFSLNLDLCDYYILTQTEAPERYTTTHLKIITKIGKDLHFSMQARKLIKFSIEAYEVDGATRLPLDLTDEKLAGLVNVRGSYYGALDTNSPVFVYLVEKDTNFNFEFKSNLFFEYKNSTLDQIYTSSVISGTYSEGVDKLIVVFERVKYTVSFKEYLKEGGRLSAIENSPYFNIKSYLIYPGQKIKLEMDDMASFAKIYLDEVELEEFSKIASLKYGFSVYSIVSDVNDDTQAYSCEIMIDDLSPTNCVINIIYEKIEYDINFEVIDKNGDISTYLKQKVKSMNRDAKIKAGENVNLSAEMYSGYTSNWTLVSAREIAPTDYLTTLSFEFVPTDNDSSKKYTYYLVVDYIYYDYDYILSPDSGFEATGPVADLIFADIKSFEFDKDSLELKVYADLYSSDAVNVLNTERGVLILTETLTLNALTNKYTSTIGEIDAVGIDDGVVTSLKILDVEFYYNDATARFEKAIEQEKNISVADDRTSELVLSISNVCIDDVILNLATISDVGTSYEFSYFTMDKKTRLSNVIMSSTFSNIPNSDKTNYGWLYNGAKDVEVIVVFSPVSQNIKVYKNLDVFPLESDMATLTNTSLTDEKVVAEEGWLSIYAVVGTTVRITVDFSKIVKGYKFLEFQFNTRVTVTLPTTVKDGNSVYVEFVMTSGFNGADVTVVFEEITYEIEVRSNEQFSGLVKKTGEDDVKLTPIEDILGDFSLKSSFTLKISDIVTFPTLMLDSTNGMYIHKAYFLTDTEENRMTTLEGNKGAQTNGELKFASETNWANGEVSFETFIQDLADENYKVTLYLVQGNREYSIVVSYMIDGERNVDPVKGASLSINDGTAVNLAGKTENSITFGGINYGQYVSLKIDDSSVNGAKFVKWTNENLDNLSIGVECIIASLTKDVVLYVWFECFEYEIEFVVVDKSDNQFVSPNDIGGAIVKTNDGSGDVVSNTFNICDIVSFSVSAKTGYEFVELYYLYGAKSKSVNGIIINKPNYTFTGDGQSDTILLERIEYFRNIFATITRSEQEDNEEYRTLKIYLVFEEKYYQIKTQVKNSTQSASEALRDTTDWLDITVKWATNPRDEYTEKDVDEVKGYAIYPTNSYIKLSFTQRIRGIVFDSNGNGVQLGGDSYKIGTIGDKTVAGQDIQLLLDGETYILYFQLTATLLETVGEASDEFVALINYYIKNYSISFTAGYLTSEGSIVEINKNKFQLNMQISLPDSLTTWSNVAGTTIKGHTLSLETKLYYGTNIKFLVGVMSSSGAYFKNSYDFVGFMIGERYVNKVGENGGQNDTYELAQMVTVFGDEEETNIWELCGASALKVYAVYSPKITLGDKFVEFENGFIKTVTYNGERQRLTSSLDFDTDADRRNADIQFNVEAFKVCVIYYNNDENFIPKDVGTYDVKVLLDGVMFEKTLYLKIVPCEVELFYKGGTVSKEYDGTNELTLANLEAIKNALSLRIAGTMKEGLCASDPISLVLTRMTGYYSDKSAGTGLSIYINLIELGDAIKRNYAFASDATIISNFELAGKGVISPKKAMIDKTLFQFDDIVYKEGENYVLKYKETDLYNALGQFKEGYSLTILNKVKVSDEVYFNLDKIKVTLDDYSIGENKTITIILSDAMAGANSTDYYVETWQASIDIYPYKLTVDLGNAGTFSIVDRDEICCIPIPLGLSGDIKASYIDSTNADYPNLFGLVEKLIKNDDRIHAFYEFGLWGENGNKYDVKELAGAYIMIPKVKGLKTVFERTSEGYVATEYFEDNQYIGYKITGATQGGTCLIVDRSYFPIWKIILIVVLILLFVGIIWFILLLLKRKREKDEENYHSQQNSK